MTTDGSGRRRPLIAVCLRYTDLRPSVDPLTGAVRRETFTAGMSAPDAAALERALRISQAWSGTVLAVTAGPPAADAMLREVAALGVAVRRVAWPDGPEAYLRDLAGDGVALATALAASIRTVGEPALVLCGDRSSDRGTGTVPAALAHVLGAAQALGLVDLRTDVPPAGSHRPADGLGATGGPGETDGPGEADAVAAWDGVLIGERRLDGGRRERLRIPQPAVCSVEGAGVRLRRAGLRAALAAGTLSIPVDEPASAGSTGDPAVRVRAARPFRPRARVVPPPSGTAARDRLLELTGALVAHDPPALVGPVDASEAADALLAYLRRGGFLS